MQIRADIAELLRTNISQAEICRRLHCAPITVQRAREALGLPAPRAGCMPGRPRTFEEALRARSRDTDDGHRVWDGWTNDGAPIVSCGGKTRSAYRVAFVEYWGREPVGRVTAGCRLKGCVRGDHLQDGRIREANRRADAAYERLFGGSA